MRLATQDSLGFGGSWCISTKVEDACNLTGRMLESAVSNRSLFQRTSDVSLRDWKHHWKNITLQNWPVVWGIKMKTPVPDSNWISRVCSASWVGEFVTSLCYDELNWNRAPMTSFWKLWSASTRVYFIRECIWVCVYAHEMVILLSFEGHLGGHCLWLMFAGYLLHVQFVPPAKGLNWP